MYYPCTHVYAGCRPRTLFMLYIFLHSADVCLLAMTQLESFCQHLIAKHAGTAGPYGIIGPPDSLYVQNTNIAAPTAAICSLGSWITGWQYINLTTVSPQLSGPYEDLGYLGASCSNGQQLKPANYTFGSSTACATTLTSVSSSSVIIISSPPGYSYFAYRQTRRPLHLIWLYLQCISQCLQCQGSACASLWLSLNVQLHGAHGFWSGINFWHNLIEVLP